MTGKLAQDGKGELITVIETICGNMTVLPLLVHVKGRSDIWDGSSILVKNQRQENT